MDTPNESIGFIPAKGGDILHLAGGAICRIQEDGSKTGNRIGAAEFTIPPKTTQGPPPHWHEMHDETFLITEGTVRFHTKNGKHFDAKVGDYIVVPPRAPHTFSNTFGEPAKFFNTFTPAFYVQYFKLMDGWIKKGETLDAEMVKKAMAYFATIGVEGPL